MLQQEYEQFQVRDEVEDRGVSSLEQTKDMFSFLFYFVLNEVQLPGYEDVEGVFISLFLNGERALHSLHHLVDSLVGFLRDNLKIVHGYSSG